MWKNTNLFLLQKRGHNSRFMNRDIVMQQGEVFKPGVGHRLKHCCFFLISSAPFLYKITGPRISKKITNIAFLALIILWWVAAVFGGPYFVVYFPGRLKKVNSSKNVRKLLSRIFWKHFEQCFGCFKSNTFLFVRQ